MQSNINTNQILSSQETAINMSLTTVLCIKRVVLDQFVIGNHLGTHWKMILSKETIPEEEIFKKYELSAPFFQGKDEYQITLGVKHNSFFSNNVNNIATFLFNQLIKDDIIIMSPYLDNFIKKIIPILENDVGLTKKIFDDSLYPPTKTLSTEKTLQHTKTSMSNDEKKEQTRCEKCLSISCDGTFNKYKLEKGKQWSKNQTKVEKQKWESKH